MKLYKVTDKSNNTVQLVPAETRTALEQELLAKHYEVEAPTKADLTAALLPKQP